ncbi:Beige/BEACH domain containing protein [Trichomonas vaginalis G3]|uniref:Beige/BEACH domain containing protein n=1 Tax=Trichomonas vaginalis (strain ATCC PRA-98 / G3) TaxID=412133 RepID=A2F322_TRIV3|nr:Beige/BEACH domain containing protein [Trichomonas vaginalis G3]|eukprot:XP_001313615.1 Beige/BEACH domain containing protein [Trichomonas vaginalis G3]
MMFLRDFFKSDEAILLNSIYKIPLEDLRSSIDEECRSLIPNEEFDLQSTKIKSVNDKAKQLSLTQDIRIALLQCISLKIHEKLEEKFQNFYSILIFRSATYILLTPLEEIKLQEYFNTISCLNYSFKFLSKYADLQSKFIELWLKKIETSPKIEFISPLTNILADYQIISQNNSYLAFKVALNLLENPNIEYQVNEQFTLSSFINSFVIFLADQIVKKDMTKQLSILYVVLCNKSLTERELIISIFKIMQVLMKNSLNINLLIDIVNTIADKPPSFIKPEENLQSNLIVMPNTPILGFHNIPEHPSSDNGEMHLFSFLEVEHMINHPLVIISNLLSRSPIFGNSQNFIKMASFVIQQLSSSDKLYFIVVLYFLISFNPSKISEFTNYMTENNYWRLLINPSFYSQRTNIFTSPKSDIVSLRCTLYEILSILMKNDDVLLQIRKSLLDVMRSLTQETLVFCEILIMTLPSLNSIYSINNIDDDLMDVILESIVIGQHRHIFGEKLSSMYRPHMFSALSNILRTTRNLQLIEKSSYSCLALSSIVFENSFSQQTLKDLRNLISHATDDDKLNNISSALHQVLLSLSPMMNSKNSEDLFHKILVLFHRLLKDKNLMMSKMIICSSILADICSIAIKMSPTKDKKYIFDTFLQILFSLQFSPHFNPKNVPYGAIGTQLNQIGVDDETYKYIMRIVSGSSDSFSKISQPESIKLLLHCFKGKERYNMVLDDLLKICQTSACNRCSCLVGGVVTFIFDHFTEENYEKSLKLFELISETICSKSSLFAFIRHFSKFESNTNLNKFIFPSICTLLNILKKTNNNEQTEVIQLSSPLSCIRSPNINYSDIKNGFIFDSFILVDDKLGERTLFELGNGVVRIVAILDKGNISVCTLDDKGEVYQNYLPAEILLSKFFHLTIVFATGNVLCVYVDGKFVGAMPLIPMSIPEDTVFNTNLIFKSLSTTSSSVQVKNFSFRCLDVFDNNNVDNFPLENSKILFAFNNNNVTNSQLSLSTPKGEVKVDFRGLGLPFFCGFMKIFEASHAIEFIVSLFGQSNLPDAISLDLFKHLTEICARLVDNSAVITSQLFDINAFDVISYFLSDLPPNSLNRDLWHLFIVIFSLLNKQDYRRSFCSSIIFNCNLWKKSDTNIQTTIIQDILMISNSYTNIFIEYMRTSTILKYLHDVLNILDENLTDQILKLLIRSINLVFEESDQHSLFIFLICCKNYTLTNQILKELLNNKVVLNDKDEFCSMFMHPDESVRLNFLKIYFDGKRNENIDKLAVFSLISNTEIVLSGEDDINNSFLTYCIAKAYGYDTNLCQILSNEDLILTDYYAFLFSIISIDFCPDSILYVAISIIQKSMHNPDNVNFILEKMSKFDFVIFLYFLITKGRNLIKEFVFLVKNKECFENMIGILDVISLSSKTDLEKIRLNIMTSLFDFMIRKYDYEIQISIEDSMIQGILFHREVNSSNLLQKEFENSIFYEKSESQNQTQTKDDLSDNLFTILLKILDTKKETDLDYNFSVYYNKENKPIYKDFSKKLLYGVYAVLTERSIPPFETFYYLMYSFFRMMDGHKLITNFAPILSEVGESTLKDDPKMFLILNFLEKFVGTDISYPQKLIEQYKADIMSNKQKEESLKLVNDFSQRKPNWLQRNLMEINSYIKEMMKRYTSLLIPLTIDSMKELQKCFSNYSVVFNRKQAEHIWRRLWQKMTFTNNPSLSSTVKLHYKRGKLIGQDFCPNLLTRNTDFSSHPEASKIDVDETEEEKSSLPSHFVFHHESRKIKEAPILSDSKFNTPCVNYKPNTKINGSFYVFHDHFTFLSEDHRYLVINFSDLSYLFWMSVCQRPNAIEIFTANKQSFYFHFPNFTDRSQTIKYITSNNFPNAIFVQTKNSSAEISSLGLTQKWLNRQISTFTYLMWLNQLSGRSFNNTQNYPVFPWILKDYASKNIDLNNPEIYRDLSKPLGALDEERLEKLKLYRNNSDNLNILYRSTYSCPFHIYFYLLRLEPFTTCHIEIQDGHFDVPGRLFSNLQSSWVSASGCMNNYKELIPEFFYFPEFLQNVDRFKFGKMMTGDVVDDVVFPPFTSSAASFVLLNREALESDYVSAHIGDWIDLIWGYSQRGQNAENKDNVFDPRLYEDVWERLADPDCIPEIESMLMNIGVIPHRLFEEKHPNRQPKKKSKPSIIVYKTNTDIKSATFSNSNIYILSNNGELFQVSSQLSLVSKIPPNFSSVSPSISNNSILFACLCSDTKSIYLLSDKKQTQLRNTCHIDSITCICTCGDYLFSGGLDGLLVEWNSQRSVMCHPEHVLCLDSNLTQNAVVTCGNDGKLVISTVNPLKFIRSVDLNLPEEGLVAQQVSIGDNGIIAVISGHMSDSVCGEYVSLYTINGSKFFDDSISCVCVQVCVKIDGTTIIAVAGQDHSVCLYKAYNMRLIECAVRCDSAITSMKYDSSSESLYIASKNGIVTIYKL